MSLFSLAVFTCTEGVARRGGSGSRVDCSAEGCSSGIAWLSSRLAEVLGGTGGASWSAS